MCEPLPSMIGACLRRFAVRSPRSGLLLSLIGLLWLATLGCAQDAGRDRSADRRLPRANVWRWFEVEPIDRFSSDLLERAKVVHEWRFDRPAERALWRAVGGPGRMNAGQQGAMLSSPNDRVVLSNRWLGDQIRGASVSPIDRIEVTIDRLDVGTEGLGSVVLHWRGVGEEFSPDRELADHGGTLQTDAVAGAAGGSRRTFRFDLPQPSAWSRTVEEIRLTFRLPESDVLALRSVRAVRRVPVARALDAAAENGIWVDLDGAMRPALPARFDRAEGGEPERTVEVPQNGVLRLAYAVSGNAPETGRFRVLLTDGTNETTEIFSSSRAQDSDAPANDNVSVAVEQKPIEPNRWHEASVDLGPWAGRSVGLHLGFDGPPEPFGRAWWSEPIIEAVLPNPESTDGVVAGRPNVVLISIDTLRADRMSLYEHERRTTPVLDHWAGERATVFEQAVAAAPWTLPSHATMLTGIDPLRHGTNYLWTRLGTEAKTLAEFLRDEGYATAAFTGGGVLAPFHGFYQGFDRYDYADGAYATADELRLGLDRALDYVAGFRRDGMERGLFDPEQDDDRPFFLFFHTYEVHAPYLPRQPWFSRFTDLSDHLRVSNVDRPPPAETPFLVTKEFRLAADAESGSPLNAESLRLLPAHLAELPGLLYDAGIAYADSQIGRLLSALSLWGLDDDTIVIITSDHGEMLGEHGLAGHTSLYDENLLVPLVVAAPQRLGAGRRVPDQVRTVDLVPTVLDLAGVPYNEVFDGRSLRPLIEGSPDSGPRDAISYGGRFNAGLALRLDGRSPSSPELDNGASSGPKGPLKYILNTSPFGGADRLYRLWRDPDEAFDVAATAPETADLEGRLTRHFARRLSGLRIRFENPGRAVFSGRLSGPAIDLAKLSTTGDCRCFAFSSENGVRFELPPGRAVDLFVEEPAAAELTIEVSSSVSGREPVTTTETFRLDRVAEEGVGLGLTAVGWSRSERGRPIGTGGAIWLRWHGPSSTSGRSFQGSGSEVGSEVDREVDRELEERLRALGYL